MIKTIEQYKAEKKRYDDLSNQMARCCDELHIFRENYIKSNVHLLKKVEWTMIHTHYGSHPYELSFSGKNPFEMIDGGMSYPIWGDKANLCLNSGNIILRRQTTNVSDFIDCILENELKIVKNPDMEKIVNSNMENNKTFYSIMKLLQTNKK